MLGERTRKARLGRTLATVFAAIATVAAVAAVLFPHRLLRFSLNSAARSERLLAKSLKRQGIVYFADFGEASPKELFSGVRIKVQGAPRVPVPGGFGRRIEDSGASYLSPPAPVLPFSKATYCLAIAPDGTDREQELLNQMGGTSGMRLSIAGGELVAEFRHGGETKLLSAPFEAMAGRLTHIAVSVADGHAMLYCNGRKRAETSLPWRPVLLPRPWVFSNSNRHPFLGVVASAGIWCRPLGDAEIARLASKRGMKASSLAPFHAFAVALAKTADGFLRGTCRIVSRLVPQWGGSAFMRRECPVLVMHMKNRDERHFAKTHEKSLFSGYRTGGAAELRSINAIFDGAKIPARAGLDDTYSINETSKRPAFIVEMDDEPLAGRGGVIRAYPPELHSGLHFDAPELFPASGRFVRLYEDSTFLGIYIVEPLDSPGGAWMEHGEHTPKALYSSAAPKEADIPARGESREAAMRRISRLLLSDSRFPWSMAEIKARRRLLAKRRDSIGLENHRDPVAPLASILGGNRAAMFITENLELGSDGLSWRSSDPATIGDDGRVVRPKDAMPRIVELTATDSATGKRQTYRLRVMPETPTLPAIFIGIGSPVEKMRRNDFVGEFVREGVAEPIRLSGLVGDGCGIRHRGNTSYVKGVKRSLSLEIGKPLAWPDEEHPSCHLLLHNGYADPTRMRNRFSFEFYHSAAAALGKDLPAPRFAWTEVFVNGEYFGVWEASGRVRDLLPQDWPLFKIRGANTWLWTRPDVSILDCLTANPGDEAAYEPMKETFAFVASASKASFAEEAERHFSLDNLAACYLLLCFTDNRDAQFMNQYFAIDPETGQTTVIPWDYDKTFFPKTRDLPGNNLYSRVKAQFPKFSEKSRECLRTLRNGEWSDEAAMRRIDGYRELLAPYMDEEWRLLKPVGFDGDFSETVEMLKESVRMRLEVLDGTVLPSLAF